MANWRNTKTPGVYVAHSTSLPGLRTARARCRCAPSWRGRRRNPVDRAGRVAAAGRQGPHRGPDLARRGQQGRGARWRERAAAGRTFESIGDEWLAGVEAGHIGRRKGAASRTARRRSRDYRRSYRHFLRPEFGPMVAGRDRRGRVADVGRPAQPRGAVALADRDARRGRLGDLRLGAASVRRYRDAQPAAPGRAAAERREAAPARRASRPRRRSCWRRSTPTDAVPYAIAFYAGLRRAEIDRLEWPEVLDGERIARRVLVTRSKSDAGTRAPPTDRRAAARASSRAAWLRQGRPTRGTVSSVA